MDQNSELKEERFLPGFKATRTWRENVLWSNGTKPGHFKSSKRQNKKPNRIKLNVTATQNVMTEFLLDS